MRISVLTGVRQGWNAHLVVVPVVRTLVEVISTQTELRLLLSPRLASNSLSAIVGAHGPDSIIEPRGPAHADSSVLGCLRSAVARGRRAVVDAPGTDPRGAHGQVRDVFG